MNAAVERYLTEVERRLPSERRFRADLLDELRDGLLTAVESRPRAHGDAEEYRRVVAEFGPPAELASDLGREVFLRQVRRSALRMLALLIFMGLLWHLYLVTVGVPATMVPDGWTRHWFLGSTWVVRVAPVLSMVGAALLVGITSIRMVRSWMVLARRILAVVTKAATVLFGLSMALIVATVGPGHRLETAAVAVPAAALLALLLHNTMQATGRKYRTRDGRQPVNDALL